MRCWVAMGSILPLRSGNTGNPCQIGPGAHFFKPCLLEQFPHRLLLPNAMLEEEPPAFGEVRWRSRCDLADRVEAVCARDEGAHRLEPERGEMRVARGDIRRGGDDDIEAPER